MKKIVLSLSAIFLFSNILFAEIGDREGSAYLGFGSTGNEVQTSDGTTLDAGGTGMGLGAQYLYQTRDRWSLGGELFYLNSGDGGTVNSSTLSTKYLNLYAVARYLPEQSIENWRFYIPFGLGVGRTTFETSGITPSVSESSYGPAFYLGVGADYQTKNPNTKIGAELRFGSSFFSKSKFHINKSHFEQFSLLFKITFDMNKKRTSEEEYVMPQKSEYKKEEKRNTSMSNEYLIL